MNTDNTTRALTVYINPDSKRRSIFNDSLNSIRNLCIVSFNARKKILLAFFLQSIFGIFFGACLCAKNSFLYYWLLSFCNTEHSVSLVIIPCVVTAFSGFSVFGKVAPFVLNFAWFSAIGVFQYTLCFGFIRTDYFVSSLSTLLVSLFSFLLIIFLTECFLFSKRAIIGKRALFQAKPIFLYLCFSSVLIYLLYLFYRIFINYFIIG